MKTLYFFLIPLVLISCNNRRKLNNSTPISSSKTESVASYRLNVSFFSKGSGSDKKAIAAFNDFLKRFEAKQETKLAFDKTNWGREGEIDFCFKLIELNSSQQEQFIKELKEVLKEFTLVHINENKGCH